MWRLNYCLLVMKAEYGNWMEMFEAEAEIMTRRHWSTKLYTTAFPIVAHSNVTTPLQCPARMP